MDRAADSAGLPWYRHLWVWLVMIPPAAAVVAGFITAWLAGSPPALVVDDYSEIALTTERRQARDQRARELGLRARLELPPAGGPAGEVRVTPGSGDPAYRWPARIRLQLIHPTHEEFDQAVTLARGDDAFLGIVARPAARVYVELADEAGDWRLVGEVPAGTASLLLEAPPLEGGR